MKPRQRFKRHVLGEGWTRYSLSVDDWNSARDIRLVKDKLNRGFQDPVPLKMQLWDKKVRLVIEEIPTEIVKPKRRKK